MKKIIVFVILILFTTVPVRGQRSKSLSKYITTVTWQGARIWRTANATTVDSVITMNFSVTGTVTWNKQGWEYVSHTKGNYTVDGNTVKITFHYPPYTHHIEAVYDPVTRRITGSFREERAVSPNAPVVYSPGTTTGEFVLYRK
jgi:hypothetical protein